MSLMKELTKAELLEISGGGISGAIITAFVRGINTILELGRSLGTAVRRMQTGCFCK